VNNEVHYIALGEKLFIPCNLLGYDYFTLLFWRKSQLNVKQYNDQCPDDFDINNSSCIDPMYEEYRSTRVKSRFERTVKCNRLVILRSTLDISIVNWTDNGSTYNCVSSSNELDPHPQNVSLNLTFIVG